MSLNQSFIAELQIEAASTNKMLANFPSDKNTWKPHEKSMTLARLAVHIAELPGWITMTMTTDELDLSKMDYKPQVPENAEELVSMHTKNVDAAVKALEASTDADFMKNWTLRNGDHIIFTMPKIAVLRSMAYSHLYHHRGQLSVYLRMLDVTVPGMYGPSADDIAAQKAMQAQAN
jgi:uncharacterized damage-inducible protein DinB